MLRPLAASLLLLAPTAWAADWPQWRGPGRDGLSPAVTPKEWPCGGGDARGIGQGASTAAGLQPEPRDSSPSVLPLPCRSA